MHRRLVLTLGVVLLATPAFGQDWLGKAEWTKDYKVALAKAKKADKLVFAFFSKPG